MLRGQQRAYAARAGAFPAPLARARWGGWSRRPTTVLRTFVFAMDLFALELLVPAPFVAKLIFLFAATSHAVRMRRGAAYTSHSPGRQRARTRAPCTVRTVPKLSNLGNPNQVEITLNTYCKSILSDLPFIGYS